MFVFYFTYHRLLKIILKYINPQHILLYTIYSNSSTVSSSEEESSSYRPPQYIDKADKNAKPSHAGGTRLIVRNSSLEDFDNERFVRFKKFSLSDVRTFSRDSLQRSDTMDSRSSGSNL